MSALHFDYLLVAYIVRVASLAVFFGVFPALRTFLGLMPIAAMSAVFTLACTPVDVFF